MKKTFLAISAAIVMAGCAQMPALPKLPDLPSLSTIKTITMGESGGPDHYQLTNYSVTIPPGTCHVDAYLDGYKNSYMSSWNDTISNRAFIARLEAKKNPTPSSAANLKLYTGKMFDRRREQISSYSIELSNRCIFQSYTQGKADAGRVAITDLNAMKAKEVY